MDLMGLGRLLLRTTRQHQPWGVIQLGLGLFFWGHWPTTPHPIPSQGLTPGGGRGLQNREFSGLWRGQEDGLTSTAGPQITAQCPEGPDLGLPPGKE